MTLAEAFDAWERGDTAASSTIVRRVLRQTPRLAGAHYLSGLLYLDRGEARKAVQALGRARRYGPDSPALRLALGRAHVLGADWTQAEENFRRALALAPGLPAGLWSLSDLLFRRDRAAEALPLLEILTRAQPRDPLPWERIGLVQRRRGKLPEALEAFDKLLELAPDLPRAHSNRAAILLDLGRVTEALDRLTEARARHPEEPGLIRNQALALVKARRAAEALPLYERLLARRPEAGLSQEYAEALMKAGRAADAVTLLQALVAVKPGDAAVRFLLGEAARAAGDKDTAAAAYQKACALDPEDRLGAGPALSLLHEGQAPGTLPIPYVKALFDEYAARFDGELTGKLQYRAPEQLRALLDQHAPRQNLRVIDVGCGTGLSGLAFTQIASQLIGIDLSPAMLTHAAARHIYQELIAGEALACLAARPEASADLILAADVLVYLGDLDGFHAAAARVLAPRGLILASLEAHPDPETAFALHEGLRYQHGANALKRALQAQAYRILALMPVITRFNRDAPVPGLAYLAERGAASLSG